MHAFQGKQALAYAQPADQVPKLPGRAWKVWLVGGDCMLIGEAAIHAPVHDTQHSSWGKVANSAHHSCFGFVWCQLVEWQATEKGQGCMVQIFPLFARW